jgi:hypothetical protein
MLQFPACRKYLSEIAHIAIKAFAVVVYVLFAVASFFQAMSAMAVDS